MTPMDGENYHPLYPYHGERYARALDAAKREYEEWERTECIPRGIYIYSNRPRDDEEDSDA